MMKVSNTLLFALVSTLMLGCASTPTEDETKTQLPGWVQNPDFEGRFGDTSCVKANADMSTLKTKATALARGEIAKQIDIQVKAMDKTYQGLTDAGLDRSSGGTFESVSKQVTSQKLSGSRATKVDYVDFPDGFQYLCVMVQLDPSATDELYRNIVDQSGRELSATDDRILWQEFKAHKAQQELDKELQNTN